MTKTYKFNTPVGSSELTDITEIIMANIFEMDNEAVVRITPYIHTAKVKIPTNRKINFQIEYSVGWLEVLVF